MVELAVILMLAIAGGATWLVVRTVQRSPLTAEERMLGEYNRLIFNAARESRKGHEGQAAIYSEAAERLLEAWRERHP